MTEIDKTFIEKISEPLLHLVRNAIDHGIETENERIIAGKMIAGTISLRAFHQADAVHIEVTDDGQGLDAEKIQKKAIASGIISAGDHLTQKQLFELIFHPGFSTAKTINNISGRGVGMDVVKENIQALGGSVYLESTLGKGTTIHIQLPLTQGVIDGQLFKIHDQTYIIPMMIITETLPILAHNVHFMGGEKGEVYYFRDQYIPVIQLHTLWDFPSNLNTTSQSILIVVNTGKYLLGFKVDEILSQEQIVINNLEKHYCRVEGFSGATVLWNGQVALIIDVLGIINRWNHHVSHFKKKWFDQYPIDMSKLLMFH
jgi:two-component system chemotaxis sensor kinase CheA